MSKNSEDDKLQKVQEQIEGLANNKELESIQNKDAVNLFQETISDTIEQLDNFKKDESLNPEEKREMIKTELDNVVQELEFINSNKLDQNKAIATSLWEASIVLNPEVELQPIKEKLEEIVKSDTVQNDKALATALEKSIKTLESGFEQHAYHGADEQSKLMLNAVDSIYANLKEHQKEAGIENKKQIEGIASQVYELNVTIHTFRDKNNFVAHQTPSDISPPSLTQDQIENAPDAIKTSKDAIVGILTKKLREEIGSKNTKEIEKLITNMETSLQNRENDESYRKLPKGAQIAAQVSIVNTAITSIEDRLNSFDKELSNQKADSKLDKAINVIKAAAKVVKSGITGTSEELHNAKIGLAAAQFKMTAKGEKLDKFKEGKEAISTKLTEAKEALPTKNKGGMSR